MGSEMCIRDSDMLACVDAAVTKKGISNVVFHPYEWIRNTQMADFVDRIDKNHGNAVKFLTFKECMQRINENRCWENRSEPRAVIMVFDCWT